MFVPEDGLESETTRMMELNRLIKKVVNQLILQPYWIQIPFYHVIRFSIKLHRHLIKNKIITLKRIIMKLI